MRLFRKAAKKALPIMTRRATQSSHHAPRRVLVPQSSEESITNYGSESLDLRTPRVSECRSDSGGRAMPGAYLLTTTPVSKRLVNTVVIRMFRTYGALYCCNNTLLPQLRTPAGGSCSGLNSPDRYAASLPRSPPTACLINTIPPTQTHRPAKTTAHPPLQRSLHQPSRHIPHQHSLHRQNHRTSPPTFAVQTKPHTLPYLAVPTKPRSGGRSKATARAPIGGSQLW